MTAPECSECGETVRQLGTDSKGRCVKCSPHSPDSETGWF